MSVLSHLLRIQPPQAAFPDTVVMVAARDGVDLVFALAAGSATLVFLAVLGGFLFALVQVRRASRKVEQLRRHFVADPALESLRKTAANVEAISEAFRTEVVHLTESVSKLSDRLEQASDRMEERIEEFNALMEVVQAEAEEVFVDTASAARGVRTGVGGVGRAAGGRKVRETGAGEAPSDDERPDGA